MNDNANELSKEELLASVPDAAVLPSRQVHSGRLTGMWWFTFASLLFAIGLVWWSMPENGIAISVRFPEGHGLQAEDQVLYRGIDIGFVENVELSDDQTAVDVQIILRSSAAELAREGTRFWIVRPQLSLSGITGLETAVGHKYVTLSPGPADGERKVAFDGLIQPPPQDGARPGVEIVIRGDKRYSVSPGSTVTFRGVVVGRILSVTLSQDSRYVDIRAKIFEGFRQNLTTQSKFWATSGINFDFSLSEGLKFDSESLASIAQGGVSFLTISNDGNAINSGHVFRLHGSPEDSWITAADTVSSTNIELGGVVTIAKRWRQKALLGQRSKSITMNGMPVRTKNGNRIIVLPLDAKTFTEKATNGSTSIAVVTSQSEAVIENPADSIAALTNTPSLGKVAASTVNGVEWLDESVDFRTPMTPESVLAVRANVDSESGNLTYLHYPIERSYMREDWSLPHFDGDSQLWHGSPVLSSDDGKVVGILTISDQEAVIVPIAANMFE